MPEQKKNSEISVNNSRRTFLRKAGVSSAVASIFLLKESGSMAFAQTPRPRELEPAQFELHFDEKQCAGCNLCETACSTFHEGMVNPAAARNSFVLKPIVTFLGMSALSANAAGWPQPLAKASFAEFSENNFCRQCASPECLDACPEQAIYIDPKSGARVVDETKCVGCGTCAEACQFDMIKVNPVTEKAVKCDFCGGDPQCVAWCPTGAITVLKI